MLKRLWVCASIVVTLAVASACGGGSGGGQGGGAAREPTATLPNPAGPTATPIGVLPSAGTTASP